MHEERLDAEYMYAEKKQGRGSIDRVPNLQGSYSQRTQRETHEIHATRETRGDRD